MMEHEVSASKKYSGSISNPSSRLTGLLSPLMDATTVWPRPRNPILTITQECRRALQKQRAHEERFADIHWVQNRLSDFNLWDAGVGASAKEQNSLDVRLHDDDTATKFVFTSLSALKTWLDIYRELSVEPGRNSRARNDSSSPGPNAKSHTPEHWDNRIEEAKDSMEKLLGILVKSGLAIRQAGAASQLNNADSSFSRHREDYKDFEAELKFSLRLKSRSIKHGGDKVLNTYNLCEEMQTSNEEDTLQHETRAVVEANVRRRHRFAFAEKRATKLKIKRSSTEKDKVALTPNVNPVALQDVPTAHDTIHQAHTSLGMQLEEASVQQTTRHSERSQSSTNKLSAHKPDSRIPNILEDDRPLAPPTVTTSKVSYPKGPKLDNNATVFTCPYCQLTLPLDIAQGLRWM
jgi:hypothetical protein